MVSVSLVPRALAALHAPVILEIPFEISETVLALGPRGGLRVAVVVAQEGRGVGVVGIQRVVDVPVETNSAAGDGTRGLILACSFEVDAEFEVVAAGQLSEARCTSEPTSILVCSYLLKPASDDGQGVGGGGEIGKRKEAGFIGARGALEAGAVTGERDLNAGDDSAGGVLNGVVQRA